MCSYNGPYINFFGAGDTPSHIFRTPALFVLSDTRESILRACSPGPFMRGGWMDEKALTEALKERIAGVDGIAEVHP